jgi:stringent starvation protein B
MQEYEINVSNIEELQMTNDVTELEQIFYRAKSVVVQGEVVSLVRENSDGTTYKFEEITTEADLDNYKQTVFKYL